MIAVRLTPLILVDDFGKRHLAHRPEALGFLVGLLVGLTGVGGGSLMTPMLVLIFGVQATTAVGTEQREG